MMHSLRTKRGQSLVIIALSATALFGIIALGLDAGRLYFERRDVQNAADAAALAGAQELIPTGANAGQSPAMQQSARTQAALYAFKTFNDTPDGANGSDMCRTNPAQGKLVSNAKWHAPNQTEPGVNLNGTFYYAQASDTHAVVLYWYGPVSPTTSGIEPAPNYEPPAMPSYTGYW